MLRRGENRKSLLILRKILESDSRNTDALFLTGLNWFNLQDYERSFKIMKKIQSYDRKYSVNVYLINTINLYKLNRFPISPTANALKEVKILIFLD